LPNLSWSIRKHRLRLEIYELNLPQVWNLREVMGVRYLRAMGRRAGRPLRLIKEDAIDRTLRSFTQLSLLCCRSHRPGEVRRYRAGNAQQIGWREENLKTFLSAGDSDDIPEFDSLIDKHRIATLYSQWCDRAAFVAS